MPCGTVVVLALTLLLALVDLHDLFAGLGLKAVFFQSVVLGPAEVESLGICLKCKILGLGPDLLNQNL